MGSLFTSLGKVINLKLLLIFFSVLLFLDIYCVLTLSNNLSQSYMILLELETIIRLILIYLILTTIVVPMSSLPLGLFFFIAMQRSIPDFFIDNEYYEIEDMKRKAIEEKNTALMSLYLSAKEDYKEKLEVYKYSFFIILLIVFSISNKIDPNSFFIFDLLNSLSFILNDNDKLTTLFFIYIPCLLFIFFSYKYVVCVEVKFTKWIKFSYPQSPRV